MATDPPTESALESSTPSVDLAAARLQSDIARAVRKVCPRWLADEADDLTQVAVSRVLGRMRVTAGAVAYTPGYLYRAAYTALVDEIRRRRRLREVPIEPETLTGSRAADPERIAQGREIRDALAHCFSRLHPSRRQPTMLYLQGHSVAEASALLDCGYKKAENLIFRGLADLRSCLAARGVAP